MDTSVLAEDRARRYGWRELMVYSARTWSGEPQIAGERDVEGNVLDRRRVSIASS